MKLFKNIFGLKKGKESSSYKNMEAPSIDEKLKYDVYPRIKNIRSQHLDNIHHLKLGRDLVLTFVQDINDRFKYILNSETEDLKQLIDKWKENIAQVEYEFFSTDYWNDLVYFNEPGDFSNEKLFDPIFINAACEKLNTDKIFISISRRHRMQMVDYYADFGVLEEFFYSHFSVWHDTKLQDEVISESILVGEKNKGTQYISIMGFRMTLYENKGQKKLDYMFYDDQDEAIPKKIDFREIFEKRKENFRY